MGGGGGQVVSVLAFYSVDPSSYPAEVYSLNSVNCLKRTKNKQKKNRHIQVFSKIKFKCSPLQIIIEV